jgi:hypothetical protein
MLTTQPQRQLLPLWDYGWLDYNEIKLSSCGQPQELIAAYLNSKYFGTSFVGQELDDAPTLHGAFWRTSVEANDFQVIDSVTFDAQIQCIRQPEGFSEPVNKEQWSAVENLVSKLEHQYQWLIMLRLTEEDEDKLHDWGFVLTIFREFILANPNSENVVRLVFGFD